MTKQVLKEFLRLSTTLSLLMLIAISCGGKRGSSEKSGNGEGAEKSVANRQIKVDSLKTFPFPEVPEMRIGEDAPAYFADHLWDKFPFADTTLISRPEITEHGFNRFIDAISFINHDLASKAIIKMLSKAQDADSLMFDHFLELCDKYLYEAASPYINEDHHIVVLNYIIESPKIDDVMKIRPRELLKVAMKNRPGDIATDFQYKLKNGHISSLHRVKADYTLLFFNNPNCGSCTAAKEFIIASELMNRLIDEKKLAVLALYAPTELYPYLAKKLATWKTLEYPKSWISGYDQSRSISDELYNLRVVPTFYLLDKDKKVILKEKKTIEEIDNWFSQNNTPESSK